MIPHSFAAVLVTRCASTPTFGVALLLTLPHCSGPLFCGLAPLFGIFPVNALAFHLLNPPGAMWRRRPLYSHLPSTRGTSVASAYPSGDVTRCVLRFTASAIGGSGTMTSRPQLSRRPVFAPSAQTGVCFPRRMVAVFVLLLFATPPPSRPLYEF